MDDFIRRKTVLPGEKEKVNKPEKEEVIEDKKEEEIIEDKKVEEVKEEIVIEEVSNVEETKKISKFQEYKKNKEENKKLDEAIITNEFVDSLSRSNKANRFNPSIEEGLDDNQVDTRIKEGLVNESKRVYSKTYKQIFINNIFTFFNILCVGVAIALISVKSYNDLTFLVILGINTVIGIVQEIKAKRTIDKLTIVTAPTAIVVRNSERIKIGVNEIVLDDIVSLHHGQQIQADSKIVEGEVEVNEALLTGEAKAVKKTVGDLLLAGSFITSGKCLVKTERVGDDCYISRLQAKAKRYSKPKSELLRSLRMITTFIAIIIIPLGAITAYNNYKTTQEDIMDPTYSTSGSFNIYALDSNNEASVPFSINEYIHSESDEGKLTPINIKVSSLDVKALGINYEDVDRVKIAYDNKVSGNISISSIVIYELEPEEYDSKIVGYKIKHDVETDELVVLYSKTFDETNIDDSNVSLGILTNKGVSRYSDGSLELNQSGSYVTVGSFSHSVKAFQVSLILESRTYVLPDEEEEMHSAILSKTITKTSGSIIGMIPAGLFLLVSIALATSVVRLSKSKTMVQELYCIEMLARVDCICLDKTGTITDGTMKVKEVIPLTKDDYDIRDIVSSIVGATADNNQTAIALKNEFGETFDHKTKAVIPFSSARKLSAASFDGIGTYMIGACEYVYKGSSKKIFQIVNSNSALGYRVLVCCVSDSDIVNDKIPTNVTPVAIIIIEDHIRPEAKETIEWFYDNGVDVKVISGDNPITVAEIAKKAGVKNANSYVSLEGLSIDEVKAIALDYTVFGRVSPDQKAILVSTLKLHGKTVAMTGDGVNDILAMKEADCSISMSTGSEAAHNVSHLVLLDSNFSNMPKVVLEGRRVINNIQRSSTLYLMKTFLTVCITVLAIVLPLLFTTGYPFTPKQFTLLEAFTIGIPSVVIALQPNKEKIKGSFMKNIAFNCITQGLCLLIPVVAIFYIRSQSSSAFTFDNVDDAISLCVVVLTYVSYVVLVNVCKPLNGLRVATLIAMFIIISLSFTIPLVATQFGVSTTIDELSPLNLLLALVIILGMIPISNILNNLTNKLKEKAINSKE